MQLRITAPDSSRSWIINEQPPFDVKAYGADGELAAEWSVADQMIIGVHYNKESADG